MSYLSKFEFTIKTDLYLSLFDLLGSLSFNKNEFILRFLFTFFMPLMLPFPYFPQYVPILLVFY